MDVEDSLSPLAVDHRDEARFTVELDGASAELVYRVEGERLVLVHTGVPGSLGGKGIGGLLVRAAMQRATDEGLTVVPWCPFARAWLRGHPDVAATVNIDWKSRPT